MVIISCLRKMLTYTRLLASPTENIKLSHTNMPKGDKTLVQITRLDTFLCVVGLR